MHRLLVIGDSFSSSTQPQSWTMMLPNVKVDNLSSNGSSQYRIYKKLQKIDMEHYDKIIIVHTSPYRIFINENFLHSDSLTLSNCDLIYQDVVNSEPSHYRDHVVWWFENIFDLEQADMIHELMVDKIVSACDSNKSLHLTFFEKINHPNLHNLNKIWKKHPGDINHLSPEGNKKVAEYVADLLQ